MLRYHWVAALQCRNAEASEPLSRELISEDLSVSICGWGVLTSSSVIVVET